MKKMQRSITSEEGRSMGGMIINQLVGIQRLNHLEPTVSTHAGQASDTPKIQKMSLIQEWTSGTTASLINTCSIAQWSTGLNKEKSYPKLRTKSSVDPAGLIQLLQQLKVFMLNIIELISLRIFQVFRNNNSLIATYSPTSAAWVVNKFMLLTTLKIME